MLRVLSIVSVVCCLSMGSGALRVHPAQTSATEQVGSPRLLWHVAGAGRGTPAADGRSVYFLSRHHEVAAVDVRSGRVRWRSPTGAAGALTDGALVLASHRSLVVGDDGLVGMNFETGQRLWTFGSGLGLGRHLGDVHAALAFAGSETGRLYAVNAGTGLVQWETPVLQAGTVFAPIVHADLVIAGFADRKLPVESGVVALDRHTGRERWRWFPKKDARGRLGEVASRPVVSGYLILVAIDDGTVHALSIGSGREQWSIGGESLVSTGHDFRPLATEGNFLVAGSLSGWVVAYDLGTRRERWRRRPVEASVAFALVASDDDVYVPYLSGQLVALDLRTGRESWRTAGRGQSFSWAPLVTNGRVYASDSNAGYFAFQR